MCLTTTRKRHCDKSMWLPLLKYYFINSSHFSFQLPSKIHLEWILMTVHIEEKTVDIFSYLSRRAVDLFVIVDAALLLTIMSFPNDILEHGADDVDVDYTITLGLPDAIYFHCMHFVITIYDVFESILISKPKSLPRSATIYSQISIWINNMYMFFIFACIPHCLIN